VKRVFALPRPVAIEDNEMKRRRKIAISAGQKKTETGKEMKCRVTLGLPVLFWVSP
jgi:hypothetical protein